MTFKSQLQLLKTFLKNKQGFWTFNSIKSGQKCSRTDQNPSIGCFKFVMHGFSKLMFISIYACYSWTDAIEPWGGMKRRILGGWMELEWMQNESSCCGVVSYKIKKLCLGPKWVHTKFYQNQIRDGWVRVKKPTKLAIFIFYDNFPYFLRLFDHNSAKNCLILTKFCMYPFWTKTKLFYLIWRIVFFFFLPWDGVWEEYPHNESEDNVGVGKDFHQPQNATNIHEVHFDMSQIDELNCV